MISATITGVLHCRPAERVSCAGIPVTIVVVRARAPDGNPTFAFCTALADGVRDDLAQLDAGDAVAVTGESALATWEPPDAEPRPSLRLLVESVRPLARRVSASEPRLGVDCIFDDELFGLRLWGG